MKCTVQRNEMVDALGKIQGLTGRRSNLAITESILIEAAEGFAHLTATDLETCFEGRISAVVEAPGKIAISARKLYEIAREFPSSDILIEEKENRWINIGNSKVHYHLMGMNPEDFPQAPQFELNDYIEVSASELKKMIEKSIIISGIGEDKKPHINGILFEIRSDQNPSRLRMVSTDGSRLSIYEVICGQDAKITPKTDVLIPKKGLHEATKFLGGSEKFRIGIMDRYFVLQSETENLAIRLLEGQYPQYADIIFRNEGRTIRVEKEIFQNMLKRMSILCTENYRGAIFTFDEGSLTINATNPEIGQSKEDMAIEFTGEKIEAAFNPRFFTEALNGIEDQSVILNLVSDHKPCLIHGAEDRFYLSAIMPMRV